MLEEDHKAELYRDYVAVTQTNIGRLLCAYLGGEWSMPDYMELMHPELKKHETKEEIIDGILTKLRE